MGKFRECKIVVVLVINRQPGGFLGASTTSTPASTSATTPVKKKRYDGFMASASCCYSVRDSSLLISEPDHPPRLQEAFRGCSALPPCSLFPFPGIQGLLKSVVLKLQSLPQPTLNLFYKYSLFLPVPSGS